MSWKHALALWILALLLAFDLCMVAAVLTPAPLLTQ